MSWKFIIETLTIPSSGGMMARVHLKDFDDGFLTALEAWASERRPLNRLDADLGLWVVHIAGKSRADAYGSIERIYSERLKAFAEECLCSGGRANWWTDERLYAEVTTESVNKRGRPDDD